MHTNCPHINLKSLLILCLHQAPISTNIARHASSNAAVNPTVHPAGKESHRLQTLQQAEDQEMVVFKDVSIQQILNAKPNQAVSSVSKTDTVYSAIKKMNEMKVGALVVAENNEPVGMISERDYLNKVILRGFSSKDITVNGIVSPIYSNFSSNVLPDIMTKEIVTIPPTVTAGDCMNLMTQGRFRRILLLLNCPFFIRFLFRFFRNLHIHYF